MIVTCTPNPSLDRTVEVSRLRRGAVHRAKASHLDAGGKGVNIPRVLGLHGVPAQAVLPPGDPGGDHFAVLLAALGVPHQALSPGETAALDCHLGGTITISAEGDEAEQAVRQLLALVEAGLGESGGS